MLVYSYLAYLGVAAWLTWLQGGYTVDDSMSDCQAITDRLRVSIHSSINDLLR